MDDLDEAIREIVESTITSGLFFDSHTVIQLLIERYSDVYHSSFSGDNTNGYHGLIANRIVLLEDDLIDRRGLSFSKTIHGTYDSCACWVRR
ncbi:MAG TPA: hypothetical protein PKJ37_12120 [Acidobacteriota bacterium]|nr:hypothetical protein [Acidobacteriota bacterium]HNT18624.1 hypothetical protein [Acidobacteriota bacterium]